MRPPSNLRAHLALGLMVVLWSGAFVGIKAALDTGIGTFDLVVIRFLIAAPAFAIVLLVRRPLGITRAALPRLFVGGALGVAAYQLTLNEGAPADDRRRHQPDHRLVSRADAADRAHDRPRAPHADAARRHRAGVRGHRRGGDLGARPEPRVRPPGGPAMGARGVAVVGGLHDRHEAALATGDSLGITAASTLAGAACTLPFVRSSTVDTIVDLTLHQLLILLWLALAVTVIGYLAWNEGVRGLDPSRASVYLYPITPLSLLAAVVLLDEPWSPALGVSCVLVLGGVALAQRG